MDGAPRQSRKRWPRRRLRRCLRQCPPRTVFLGAGQRFPGRSRRAALRPAADPRTGGGPLRFFSGKPMHLQAQHLAECAIAGSLPALPRSMCRNCPMSSSKAISRRMAGNRALRRRVPDEGNGRSPVRADHRGPFHRAGMPLLPVLGALANAGLLRNEQAYRSHRRPRAVEIPLIHGFWLEQAGIDADRSHRVRRMR